MPFNTFVKVDLGQLAAAGQNTHVNGAAKAVQVSRAITVFMTVASIGTDLDLTLIGSYDGTNFGALRNMDGSAITLNVTANGTYTFTYHGLCPFVAVELTAINVGTPTVDVRAYRE